MRAERLTGTTSQRDLEGHSDKLELFPAGNGEPLIGLCLSNCETELTTLHVILLRREAF